MTTNVTDFIDGKGGVRGVAKALSSLQNPACDIKYGAVALWRHRNKLPRGAWPDLLRAFSTELSLADLYKIEAASPPRRPNRVKRSEAGEQAAA